MKESVCNARVWNELVGGNVQSGVVVWSCRLENTDSTQEEEVSNVEIKEMLPDISSLIQSLLVSRLMLHQNTSHHHLQRNLGPKHDKAEVNFPTATDGRIFAASNRRNFSPFSPAAGADQVAAAGFSDVIVNARVLRDPGPDGSTAPVKRRGGRIESKNLVKTTSGEFLKFMDVEHQKPVRN